MDAPELRLRLPRDELEALDQAIARGDFSDRTDAIRRALAHLLRRRANDEEIAASYRRAYERGPDEETGDVGLRLLAESIRDADKAKR